MDMVETVLASHKHLHGLGLMYVNFTFFTYISLTFLYIVVGTLTLSAYRLSETCENLHYVQKTTTGLPTWAKSKQYLIRTNTL